MGVPIHLLGYGNPAQLSPSELLLCCGPVVWLVAIAVEIVGIAYVMTARLAPTLSAWTLGLWLLQGAIILAAISLASFSAEADRPERRAQYASLIHGSAVAAVLVGTATLVASTALFLSARQKLTRRMLVPTAKLASPPPRPSS